MTAWAYYNRNDPYADSRDRGRWENPCIQRRVKMGKQINLSMLDQGISASNAANIGKIAIAEAPPQSAQKSIASGLDAQTGNSGRLNPQFQCWLMGIRRNG